MKILLANPRGFCAGVDRAIEIVERALDAFGAPIYVRHEVVHNKFVVDRLRDRGAVFVDEIAEILERSAAVAIAGGHVAVLANRLRLFAVAELVGETADIERMEQILDTETPASFWYLTGTREPDPEFLAFLGGRYELVDEALFLGASARLYRQFEPDRD